jgi:hypothetical protein
LPENLLPAVQVKKTRGGLAARQHIGLSLRASRRHEHNLRHC